MPTRFSNDEGGAETTLRSVRTGRFGSLDSVSGSVLRTGIRWTNASASVLQKPVVSSPGSFERVMRSRVDVSSPSDFKGSSSSSSSSSSSFVFDFSYPIISSFSFCQKIYFSTKADGSNPAIKRSGMNVCVPTSVPNARVTTNDGLGSKVVIGTPADMDNIPPTRSG